MAPGPHHVGIKFEQYARRGAGRHSFGSKGSGYFGGVRKISLSVISVAPLINRQNSFLVA